LHFISYEVRQKEEERDIHSREKERDRTIGEGER